MTFVLKKGEEIEIPVDDVAYGGKGISKIETEKGRCVVFTQNTLPGQKVKVRLEKLKKNYAEARVIEVTQASSLELENNFQPVSGAPYISLPITEQHKLKTKWVLDLFSKIGKIENPQDLLEEYVASPNDYFYRNKVEYSFSSIIFDKETQADADKNGLGFKRKGTWWMVEPLLKPSGLFDEEFEKLIPQIQEYCEKTKLPFWHAPQKKGFFRHLIVRKSFSEDKLLIGLTTTSKNIDAFDSKAFHDFLKKIVGKRLSGFVHIINNQEGDFNKLHQDSYFEGGANYISENILGLDFDIYLQSFFQTNPKCAEKLYSKVIDYAKNVELNNDDIIMDLFCGTGTIAQLLAKANPNKQIVGVDIVEEAIENAKTNAIKNNTPNTKFYADDVGKFLLNHPEYTDKIGLIILDPPRGGIAPKTLRKVMRLNAKNIVYVSCNPATQARDLVALKEEGYELQKFSLADQFPHTSHIETVALLKKQS